MQSEQSPGRLKRWAQRVGRRIRQWRGVEPRTRVEIRCDPSREGGWWICPETLRPGDIAYSIDRACDLRLERVLMEDYGARVYLFDPDRETVGRAEADGLLDRLQLFPVRVGPGPGGTLRPADRPEPDPAEAAAADDDVTGRTPLHPLGELMEKLGHRRLDLLKIDVNAAGPIVEELAALGTDVRQLLVRLPRAESEAERERVEALVESLHARGYRIYAITPDGRRYSFLRTDFDSA